jgi:hypothetical protein
MMPTVLTGAAAAAGAACAQVAAVPSRHAAARAADLKTILKVTLFSLFSGGPDEIETNRNQSLIGLKLFPLACAIRGHYTNLGV